MIHRGFFLFPAPSLFGKLPAVAEEAGVLRARAKRPVVFRKRRRVEQLLFSGRQVAGNRKIVGCGLGETRELLDFVTDPNQVEAMMPGAVSRFASPHRRRAKSTVECLKRDVGESRHTLVVTTPPRKLLRVPLKAALNGATLPFVYQAFTI